MKNLARILAIGAVVLLYVQPASAQLPSRPFLTGKWEGVLTGVGPNADGSPSMVPPMQPERGQVGFRLDIRGDNLVMYFQSGDNWIGLGEGQDFRLNDVDRSAIVITALAAAGGAIESMMLNIVRWDEESIVIHMSRVTGAAGGQGPQLVNLMGSMTKASF